MKLELAKLEAEKRHSNALLVQGRPSAPPKAPRKTGLGRSTLYRENEARDHA